MPALENEAHEQFANEYLRDYNATAAGRRCGYSDEYGRQLVRNVTVKARIAELRDELTERTEITAERIARAYAEIAFYDGRDMARVLDALALEDASYGENRRPLHERLEDLPRAVTAPIRKLSKRVDNKGTTYTVEAYDRHRALEVLRDRYWSPEVTGDELVEAIQSLRDRGDVPDMSEDNASHNTQGAADVSLDDIPDTTGAPDDPSKAKWHERRRRPE